MKQAGPSANRRTPDTAHAAIITAGRQPQTALICFRVFSTMGGASLTIPQPPGETHAWFSWLCDQGTSEELTVSIRK